MDLNYSSDEQAFRAEVLRFPDTKSPAANSGKVPAA